MNEQRFALCLPGRLADELAALGAPTYWLGHPRLRRPWSIPAARRRFRRWLQDEAIEVAICHSWWPYGMFAPALERAGVPVALWVHDAAGGQPMLERWARRTRPGLLIACGNHVAASLASVYPGQPVSILVPPLPPAPPADPEARAALRRSLNTPGDSFVILTASRLERWKGHTLLLDALALLPPEIPWLAWIAGGAQRPKEQTYLAGLRTQAQRLGLESRLRWLGQRTDVAALMAAADLFCQPNTAPEPFGLVFIEALAAGLPVVATALGGALDILTPECSRLAEPTPASVAAALTELLRSPTLRAALAAAGPTRAAALADPRRQMQRLEALLLTLAGRSA